MASFDKSGGIRGLFGGRDGDAGSDRPDSTDAPATPRDAAPDAPSDAPDLAPVSASWSLGDHAPTEGVLSETIEVIAPPLHAQGSTSLGQFRRLSDCINLQPGFLVLRDAQVWNPCCSHLQGPLPILLIDKDKVTLIGQRTAGGARGGDEAAFIPKVRRRLTAVLPGHVVSGHVFLHKDAALDVFLESRDPRFIPLADAEVVSADDGEPVARYAFALLRRDAVIAAPPSADEGTSPPEPERMQADETASPGSFLAG